eukprot:TRINITY_DN38734_c0_g1_i2.p1 TRINITY_DN38734_c0_g1~~TRINITY_DN38734_c0_g1_i2.p1  ORF type:complete len:147 (-),score=11.10 TRINITY_DN38734_c0_g1_i2:65-505(-)
MKTIQVLKKKSSRMKHEQVDIGRQTSLLAQQAQVLRIQNQDFDEKIARRERVLEREVAKRDHQISVNDGIRAHIAQLNQENSRLRSCIHRLVDVDAKRGRGVSRSSQTQFPKDNQFAQTNWLEYEDMLQSEKNIIVSNVAIDSMES